MRFENKVVVITGGAQGLGEAMGKRFAAEGAGVVLADINAEGVQKTAENIAAEYGVKALGLRMNVCDEEEVKAAFDRVKQEFGRVDIFISNAGVLKAHELMEFPMNEWKLVMDVNLLGYAVCAKHACLTMKDQGCGSIVQINSKSGKKGSFRNSAYAASKFGGIGLTQSLALEMAVYGIRVNAVCPGNLLEGTLWQNSLFEQYARTQGLSVEEVKKKYMDQVPLGRGCEYDDVCNVVMFLASEDASYMTGQAINVTGGQEMR